MPRKLLDDGENQAVRCFLMLYGQKGVTVANMQDHMISCGFAHWPEWADTTDAQGHLTKGGAQDWLRHLFALEGSNAEISPPREDSAEQAPPVTVAPATTCWAAP